MNELQTIHLADDDIEGHARATINALKDAYMRAARSAAEELQTEALVAREKARLEMEFEVVKARMTMRQEILLLISQTKQEALRACQGLEEGSPLRLAYQAQADALTAQEGNVLESLGVSNGVRKELTNGNGHVKEEDTGTRTATRPTRRKKKTKKV